MCGIFFYHSDKKLDEKSIIATSHALKNRGPDFTVQSIKKGGKIVTINSILSISSASREYKFPDLKESEVFAYNGEVFSHPSYDKKDYYNDTEFVLNCLRNDMLNSFYDPSFFGFFAGIYSSNINNEVIIFNDFLEKKIYSTMRMIVLL